jgi:hypothetical protein
MNAQHEIEMVQGGLCDAENGVWRSRLAVRRRGSVGPRIARLMCKGKQNMKLCLLLSLSAALFFCCVPQVARGATEMAGTVYLDNVKGSDQFDGSSAIPGEGGVGPVASITHASAILKPCEKLVIANTGIPYRGTLLLCGKGGTPETPLIVEGNGATLEGLLPTKPSDWTVLKNGVLSMKWYGMPYGFMVVADGKPPVFAKSLRDIKPGESYYNKPLGGPHPGYYRLPEGKRLEDMTLEVDNGGFGCGVEIVGASNIIIRNLKCRYFNNDGFNIQGECEGLLFEHIEGYLNGDQGFSCHATVACQVVDGYFHEDDSGIADTVFSRSSFDGVVVTGNRSFGVLFEGGDHSIVNSRIANNARSIILEQAGGANDLPGTPYNPYTSCRLYLRNTSVEGGDIGLRLREGSRASVNYCVFRNQPTCFLIEDVPSRLHVTNSIIAPLSRAISCRDTGSYWGDYNCWAKTDSEVYIRGFDITDSSVQPPMERHSIVADPLFTSSHGPQVQQNSPVRGKAFVDPSNVPWLKNSGFLDPKYPLDKFPLMYPDEYPDMGCQVPH